MASILFIQRPLRLGYLRPLNRLFVSPRPSFPPGQIKKQCFIASSYFAYWHLQTTWAWCVDLPSIIHTRAGGKEKHPNLQVKPSRHREVKWLALGSHRDPARRIEERAPNFSSSGLSSATSNSLIAGETALLWRGLTRQLLITAWGSMLISTSP